MASGLGVADQAPPSPLLASIFQDHAVLQRDRPIAVWGRAAAGETVSVSLDGQQASARADASGRWSAELPAMGAGGPFTLEARAASGAAQTLSDILVGDVWLCSGQSNMELTVSRSRNGEWAAARSADDRLRLLTVPHADRLAPAADLPAGALWRLAAPETVRTFSAACYFAGRELRDTVKVPMGLVVAAWGGSAAEAWTAEAGLRSAGGFDDRLDLLRLSRGGRDGRPPAHGPHVGGLVAHARRGRHRALAARARPHGRVGRRARAHEELEDVGRAARSPGTTAWCGSDAPSR